MEAMTLSPEPRTEETAVAAASIVDADEAATALAASRGDRRAFETLVHLHHRRVLCFIQQMTRHRQDAEDLTQQTFVKAFQHIHRVDGNRPIINWLLTIARRTTLNHFRATKKWTFVPAETVSAEASPARQLEEQERSDNLWARARRVLSQREFEVLWLRFGEDMSTEETARIAGLTKIHVKVLVHRARQRLLKGDTDS
jgi:RNA polymerase sigma-70 factor (ECF subfamily)